MVADDVAAWRQDRFEELGFSKKEAKALAEATETSRVRYNKKGIKIERLYENPLHFSKVQKLLENGASKADILEIYL